MQELVDIHMPRLRIEWLGTFGCVGRPAGRVEKPGIVAPQNDWPRRRSPKARGLDMPQERGGTLLLHLTSLPQRHRRYRMAPED